MNKQDRVYLIDMCLKIMRFPKYTADGRETLDYEAFDKWAETIRKLSREGDLFEEWEDLREQLEEVTRRGPADL